MKIENHYAEAAPILNPLSYPGAWLPHSAVVSHDRLEFVESHHLETLTAGKIPILAIGSNAAPAQLRYKLRNREFSVLNLLAEVSFSIGYAPFRAPYGSIPATPIFDQGAAVVRCQWVEQEELDALDKTEVPHYSRSTVLANVEYFGELEVQIYSSVYGALRDQNGKPIRLNPIHEDGVDQRTMLATYGDQLPTVAYGVPLELSAVELV